MSSSRRASRRRRSPRRRGRQALAAIAARASPGLAAAARGGRRGRCAPEPNRPPAGFSSGRRSPGRPRMRAERALPHAAGRVNRERGGGELACLARRESGGARAIRAALTGPACVRGWRWRRCWLRPPGAPARPRPARAAPSSSALSSSRKCPRASERSSASEPRRVRSTRLTIAPWRSKSWRTSLPLAPRAVIAYQRLAPSPPAASQPSTGSLSPLSSTPPRTPSICCSVSSPRTLTLSSLASAAHRALQACGELAVTAYDLEARRRCAAWG